MGHAMTVFFDDFERANGAPGGNWANTGGTVTIAGGALTWTGFSQAVNTTVSANGRIEARAHVTSANVAGYRCGPVVKKADTGGTGFCLAVSGTSNPYTIRIRDGGAVNGTSLVDASLAVNLPPYFELVLVWDDGHLSGYYEGELLLELDSELYFNNTYAGVAGYSTGSVMLDFTAIGGSSPSLSVNPGVIGNYGTTTELTFTGGNTAWTSGTPGSPTFTCDHGTLSDQSVTDADTATATYDPGLYLGTVTFTDPSTGATATITVTSNPGVVPPSGGLSAAAIAYIERSAVDGTDPVIANRQGEYSIRGASIDLETILAHLHIGIENTQGGFTGDAPDPALVYTLWRAINGQKAPPTGPFPDANFTTLDAGLGLVKGDLDALMGESEWTLPDLLAYLGGDPIASHRDIMTALGSVEFDDTAILDAIAAMQGDPLATIKAVLDYLFAMRTVNEYTLGNVKTWVEGVQGSGLPTVKDLADRLALIQPTTANSIDDILTKVVGQTTLQSIIDLAVLALAGTEGATIAAVLSGISDLAELINGLTVSVNAPPVWPGIDGVTLGDPVALASQLTIDEPMDGCLVDVTGVDGGVAFYTYGGVKAYRNVGALCFLTDQGDLEDWQLLGREHAIYTPRTMTHAAGLKLFTGHGLVGTVTPWTVD